MYLSLLRSIVVMVVSAWLAVGAGAEQEIKDKAWVFPGAADLSQAEDSPAWVGSLDQAGQTGQLFVVAVTSGTKAEITMHQRNPLGVWKQILSTTGAVGRRGLGKTAEGDGRTPTGVYRFNYAFGIGDDPGCPMGYYKVTADDYWSGDQREGYGYNRMVSISQLPDLNRAASEHIIDNAPQYQYCLSISYNEAGVPGLGSAIFLHGPNRNSFNSAGCVVIPGDDMLTVMRNVTWDCVVIIDTRANSFSFFYLF